MISAKSIVSALIAFFQRRFPDGPTIGADTDVKTLSEQRRGSTPWRAMTREINRIPEIRSADLALDETAMEHLSTIAELAAELLRSRSRQPRMRGPARAPARHSAKKAPPEPAARSPALESAAPSGSQDDVPNAAPEADGTPSSRGAAAAPPSPAREASPR